MELTLAEANLVKRLRSLRPARYLLVLDVDGGGLSSLAVAGGGKVEALAESRK